MVLDNLHIKLRVRSYIEPIIQCYNCLFCHVKKYCKRDSKCVICTDKLHGEKPLYAIIAADHINPSWRVAFMKNKELKNDNGI